MNNPKVSVISTVYNGEKHFDKAIPSILNQTFKDFEYIIVDDGSDDNTQSLLKKLEESDNRIKVFTPGRLGRTKALNYAIKQARGEYIVQQDFDDISYSNRIELQVEFLEANPDIGIVGGHYLLVDQNRNEEYIRATPVEHTKILKAMSKYIPLAHTIATFRKKAWEEVGGYPELDDIEDLHLWISIVKNGWKIANIPILMGEHKVYANSYWHKSFKYANRQKKLARAQYRAVIELNQSKSLLIYPLGRYLYTYLPTDLKKIIRRSLGGSTEKDTHTNRNNI